MILVRLPKYLKIPFLISFLSSLVISLSFLVLYFGLQPQVPLFYSLPEPANYLVNKQWLIIFPIFSFLVTLGHFYYLRTTHTHEKVIREVAAWSTVVIQLLIALAYFRIIFIIL